MRKLYSIFVIALLLPVFAFAADYCQPGYPYNGERITSGAYKDRILKSITVSDGISSIALTGLSSKYTTNLTTWSDLTDEIINSKIGGNQMFIPTYTDKSDVVLRTTAGSTINLNVDGADHWICQYFYIDFDNDGTFDVDATKAEANGDLVAHTGYDPSGADPTVDSDGNTVVYGLRDRTDSRRILPIPSYTLPADMKPGTYRARYKMEWNKVDACNTSNTLDYQKFLAVCDFTIEIISPRTVAVATENETYGSVAIENVEGTSVTTDNAVTVVATPAAGYSFMNWTNGAGQVVSTEATYTYSGDEDVTLTAHFGFAVTIETAEGGTISVYTELYDAVANGTVVAPGTKLRIAANATDDYHLVNLLVNGIAVEVGTVIEVNEAVTISATFSNRGTIYINNSTADCGEVFVVAKRDRKTWEPNEPIYVNGNEVPDDLLYVYFVPSEGYELYNAKITGDANKDIEYNDSEINEKFCILTTAGTRVDPTGETGDVTEIPEGEKVKYIYYTTSRIEGDLEISAVFATATAAINGIDADNTNAPVEYFNLQGMRVNADNLTPGIYVTRQGNKTAKVLIK